MLDTIPTWAGPAIVLVHGISHAGAIAALAWIRARPGTDTGGWTAARSWLAPGLADDTARLLAASTWGLACLLFVAAAVAVAGAAPGLWRSLAIVGAVVSTAGIATFAGTWPPFNTAAALAANATIAWFALTA